MDDKPDFTLKLDSGQIQVEIMPDGHKRWYIDTGKLPKDKADEYVKKAFSRVETIMLARKIPSK